jgi:RNA polymerase subunit RPABC4/transcription elongation factor Spt4
MFIRSHFLNPLHNLSLPSAIMNSSATESSPASLLTEWCRLVVRQPLDTAVAQARGWFGFLVIIQYDSLSPIAQRIRS